MNLKEFFNSTTDTLNERISSPFFGTVILSWCAWNWRVFYLTFFVDADRLPQDKLTILEIYFLDNNNLIIWGPLLTALALLLIVPFITIGFIWVSNGFDVLRERASNYFKKSRTVRWDDYMQLFLAKKQLNEEYQGLDLETSKKIDSLEKEISILTQEKNNLRIELNSTKTSSKISILDKESSIFRIYARNKVNIHQMFRSTDLRNTDSIPLINFKLPSDQINNLVDAGVIELVNDNDFKPPKGKIEKIVEITELGRVIRSFWEIENNA